MTRRDELWRLTYQLRRYLEDLRDAGVVGLPAAPPEAREAFEERRAARERAELERIQSALHGDGDGEGGGAGHSAPSRRASAAPPDQARAARERTSSSSTPDASSPKPSSSKKVERPGPTLEEAQQGKKAKATKAPRISEPDGEDGALWKQLGSRPARLFKKPGASSTKGAQKMSEQGKDASPLDEDDARQRDRGAAGGSAGSDSPTQDAGFTEVRRKGNPTPQDPPRQRRESNSPSLFGEEWDAKHDPTRTPQPMPGFDATDEQVARLDDMDQAQKLDFLRECLGDCTRCKLSQERNKIVFGDGAAEADLVFIGEGPGYNEDRQGIPFVGKAGQLLNKMIMAMGTARSEIYIANVVKCRPPNNRDPEPDEIAKCSPFLYKQLETIEPRAIITLGRFASQCVLDTDASMRSMRGRWQDWRGIPVMPTYHPAYLLRNGAAKRDTWEDLQKVMKMLGLESPS